MRLRHRQLNRLLAQFGALNIEQGIEPEHIEPLVRKKAALQEHIEQLQAEVKTLKDTRKSTAHHIEVKDLPEPERFRQLSPHSKHLIDTIKMIAYRAESAMANALCENLSHPDETRSLLRALYATEADLLPDYPQRTLNVRLTSHGQRIFQQCDPEIVRRTERDRNLVPAHQFAARSEIGRITESARSGSLNLLSVKLVRACRRPRKRCSP